MPTQPHHRRSYASVHNKKKSINNSSAMNSSTTDGTISNNLLWASTGGGWRAMFADVGYANVFRQAGLLGPSSPSSSKFEAISTVSGGSWFSAQLFYSPQFYNRSALAASPQEINDFVLQWMATYYEISTDISPEIMEACDSDLADLYTDSNQEMMETMTEFCYLLTKYDYDWARFVQDMLRAASASPDEGGYGTEEFVDTPASPENVVAPLQSTDLLVQSALAPTSRVRRNDTSTDMAVYLGDAEEQLWTVALPAAWIVDSSTGGADAEWAFGIDKDDSAATSTASLQTYVAETPDAHSWSDWRAFHLYAGKGTTTGTALIDNTADVNAQLVGPFLAPFSGATPTTLQVAATSSAAAGSFSPMAPVSYSQNWSIGNHAIYVWSTDTVWRVLAGIAAGLGAGILLGWAVAWATNKWPNLCKSCNTRRRTARSTSGASTDKNDIAKSGGGEALKKAEEGDALGDAEEGAAPGEKEEVEEAPGDAEEEVPDGAKGDAKDGAKTKADEVEYNNCCCCSCDRPARKWGIGCGIFFGILFGVFTGVYYGLGSKYVPNFYNEKVDELYQKGTFDNFAVCSQWPNLPCQEQDGFLIDGWFADNPALSINIGHRQTKVGRDETIKVVLTNTNEVWDSEWNRAQYLAYFSTYFNQDIAPGEFSWGPGWYVPSRSQQIFSEYLDADGLDALLEPIANSNMTTALLQGTTVDNPAYNVRAGQRVEMLLLNANANITTYVIGKSQIEKYTQPLADMASHIAGSEELVARVLDFVME